MENPLKGEFVIVEIASSMATRNASRVELSLSGESKIRKV